jgi:hypothetical protein
MYRPPVVQLTLQADSLGMGAISYDATGSELIIRLPNAAQHEPLMRQISQLDDHVVLKMTGGHH